MAPIRTPEESPRLFDMVRVKDASVRPAFYFALRDTLVAQDMEQATRMAFQKDKRWRVVTLRGQIIEMAGGCHNFIWFMFCISSLYSYGSLSVDNNMYILFLQVKCVLHRNHDWRRKSTEGQDGLLYWH